MPKPVLIVSHERKKPFTLRPTLCERHVMERVGKLFDADEPEEADTPLLNYIEAKSG